MKIVSWTQGLLFILGSFLITICVAAYVHQKILSQAGIASGRGVVGQALVFLLISLKLLLLVTLNRARNCFGFIAPGKIACYDKEIRPCFYLLTVNRVKITFAQRQIMNGIQ